MDNKQALITNYDNLTQPEATMGRPPKAIKMSDPIPIRFSEAQLDHIDKLLKARGDLWPNVGVTNRSDLIRFLVTEALQQYPVSKRSR
jgi:hypothetical protein